MPTRKYSRLGRVRSGARPILLIFSLVALPFSRTASGRAPSPRRFASQNRRSMRAKPSSAKTKRTPVGVLLFWRRRRDLKGFAPTRRNSRLSPYRSRYSFSPPIPPSFLHPPGALRAGCPCRNRQGSNLDFADEKIGQTEWSVLFFGGEGEI